MAHLNAVHETLRAACEKEMRFMSPKAQHCTSSAQNRSSEFQGLLKTARWWCGRQEVQASYDGLTEALALLDWEQVRPKPEPRGR